MTLHSEQTKQRRWISIILITIGALVILEACGTIGASQTVVVSIPTTLGVPTAVTETPRPTHTMNPDYATRYALATVGAHNREQFLTAIALSPIPTDTPGRRPDAPTLTPVMGMLPGCLPFGNGAGLPFNCWQGLVNGQILILKAGTGGYGHDEAQGFVWINTPDQREDGRDIYYTPQPVGPVKIVAVDGLRFTVAPAGPNPPPVTFVFDLATRQWVTPSTTPAQGTTGAPFTIQWGGTSWTQRNAGWPANTNPQLRSVAAASATERWTVGSLTFTRRTLTENALNNDWQMVSSPNPATGTGSYDDLYGVTVVPGSTDFWAVGTYGSDDLNNSWSHGLILRYTAGTPTPTATPTSTPTDTPFPLPPQYTKSYYIQSNAITDTRQLGCTARRRQEVGLVVLDFGSPRINIIDSLYGTKPYLVDDFFSNDLIENLVLAFADGYAHPDSCPGPEPLVIAPDLVISIGVSNSARKDNPNKTLLDNQDLTEQHGDAWAQLVNDVNTTLADKKLYPDISAVAGYDAEYYGALFADCRNLSTGRRGPCPNPNPVGTPVDVDEWTRYTPSPNYGTKHWAEGYDAQAVQYPKPIPLYNFGSCEDCPRTQDPSIWNANTNTRTVLQRVTYLNWDLFTEEPVPQIYFEPRAYEWYNVRWWYKVEHNAYMYVYGSMTQCGSAGCLGFNSTTRLQPRFDESCQPSTPCTGDWVPFNCLTDPCPNLPPQPGWQALVDMLSSRHTPERTPNPNLYPQPRMPFEPTDIIVRFRQYAQEQLNRGGLYELYYDSTKASRVCKYKGSTCSNALPHWL